MGWVPESLLACPSHANVTSRKATCPTSLIVDTIRLFAPKPVAGSSDVLLQCNPSSGSAALAQHHSQLPGRPMSFVSFSIDVPDSEQHNDQNQKVEHEPCCYSSCYFHRRHYLAIVTRVWTIASWWWTTSMLWCRSHSAISGDTWWRIFRSLF